MKWTLSHSAGKSLNWYSFMGRLTPKHIWTVFCLWNTVWVRRTIYFLLNKLLIKKKMLQLLIIKNKPVVLLFCFGLFFVATPYLVKMFPSIPCSRRVFFFFNYKWMHVINTILCFNYHIILLSLGVFNFYYFISYGVLKHPNVWGVHQQMNG